VRVDTYFTIAEAEVAATQDATVVVIDVVRATTTIVEALANGARGIFPTRSIEEAVKLAASLGREDTLLCGERRGVKIDGFDLGNSPSEFTREVVDAKRLVMSTSNGTTALTAAPEARRILACALSNLGAVADAIQNDEHLVLVCAGRQGGFTIEDALCAGHLLLRIEELRTDDADPVELNDASLAALTLGREVFPDVDFLRGVAAGKALAEISLEGDLEACAAIDRHSVVPEMRDQSLVAGS
jgi:2-phosphosulfolactate phosphatase